MKTLLNLKPGQKGTKSFFSQYGERLVCVRYRYDENKRKRFKTIELIVDEKDWVPSRKKKPDKRQVGIVVDFNEKDLRHKIKRAGRIWNPEQKLWRLCYDKAIKMGLRDRII